jgi:hypothetical protein
LPAADGSEKPVNKADARVFFFNSSCETFGTASVGFSFVLLTTSLLFSSAAVTDEFTDEFTDDSSDTLTLLY